MRCQHIGHFLAQNHTVPDIAHTDIRFSIWTFYPTKKINFIIALSEYIFLNMTLHLGGFLLKEICKEKRFHSECYGFNSVNSLGIKKWFNEFQKERSIGFRESFISSQNSVFKKSRLKF